jgi:type I restriction enzyme M protein
MNNDSATIVKRLWNYFNVLCDDGVSYGDYFEQLTFQLFLKPNVSLRPTVLINPH